MLPGRRQQMDECFEDKKKTTPHPLPPAPPPKKWRKHLVSEARGCIDWNDSHQPCYDVGKKAEHCGAKQVLSERWLSAGKKQKQSFSAASNIEKQTQTLYSYVHTLLLLKNTEAKMTTTTDVSSTAITCAVEGTSVGSTAAAASSSLCNGPPPCRSQERLGLIWRAPHHRSRVKDAS
jgi:hypothetical protein